MPKTVGAIIRQHRKERGLTQAELAALAHTSQGVLSAIESGTQLPPIDLLISIAAALDTAPSVLLAVDSCPVCGFEYTQDEALSSPVHTGQHARAERIIAEYGFYWPYLKRHFRMDRARTVLTNPSASEQAKYDATMDILRALFSRSVSAWERSGHPDFETYVRLLLGKERREYNEIPESIIERLKSEYGTLPGMDGAGTYYHAPNAAPGDSSDPRIQDLFEQIKSLPPEWLDVVERICQIGKSR